MRLPKRVPGLKWLTILLALYAVIWISLEGRLAQVLILSAGLSSLLFAYLFQRYLGGRQIGRRAWLVLTSVMGFLLALSFGSLTLLLMAVKTGLHGHGPEFTPDQISWLLRQIPTWGVIGLIVGLGFGLIVVGLANPGSPK